MAGKKQEKAIAKVLDSPEMTRMIDMSLGEIDRLTSKLVEGGVSEQTARDEIENTQHKKQDLKYTKLN